MNLNQKYWKIFGIGPFGVALTILIWIIVLALEHYFNLPQMTINTFLRTAFLLIFIIDGVYLLIGSSYYLKIRERGEKIVKEGPYLIIRHPLYGAVIYSGTGILAMLLKSWGIIISVIPITFMWSWLVQFEENAMLQKFGKDYQTYMGQTGQFLPSWRKMKEQAKQG